jgi:hypothetical protein
MRPTRTTRLAAALVAALALSAATPLTAASAEVENIWSRWTNEVLDREAKWEIPFAILASVPAMLLITPIWAGQLALEKWGD